MLVTKKKYDDLLEHSQALAEANFILKLELNKLKKELKPAVKKTVAKKTTAKKAVKK